MTLHPHSADPLQVLLDIEAIKQLKARYCRHLDLREWDQLRSLFTDDAEVESPSSRLPGAKPGVDGFVEILARLQEGRDEAYGNAEASPGPVRTGIHHSHLPEIEITGKDTARGIWRLTTIHPPAEPLPVPEIHFGFGIYDEEYRREQDTWKISRLSMTLLREDRIAATSGFTLVRDS